MKDIIAHEMVNL